MLGNAVGGGVGALVLDVGPGVGAGADGAVCNDSVLLPLVTRWEIALFNGVNQTNNTTAASRTAAAAYRAGALEWEP